MSGQKVTARPPVRPPAAPGSPQEAEPAAAVPAASIPPFYCVVITAEASALFELSQEVPPPQQHLRAY